MRTVAVLRTAGLAALLGLAVACGAPPVGGPAQDDVLLQPAPAALGGFAALAAPVPSSEAIVPECVPRSGPPYQLGAVGSFSGGGLTLVEGVAVDGFRGTFCGVATVVPAPPERPDATVCAQLVAPAAGLAFAPIQTRVTLIRGVETVIGEVSVAPESFTAFICDDQQPGPIEVRTTVLASAVPGLFGTACQVGPISAAVRGSISGSLKDFSARLESGTFPVSAVQATPTCPSGLATNTNAILGLPLPASASGLSLDVRGAVYLPPDPG